MKKLRRMELSPEIKPAQESQKHFSVPPDYLEQLPLSVMQNIMNHEGENLVQKKVQTYDRSDVHRRFLFSPVLYLAASVIMVWFMFKGYESIMIKDTPDLLSKEHLEKSTDLQATEDFLYIKYFNEDLEYSLIEEEEMLQADIFEL